VSLKGRCRRVAGTNRNSGFSGRRLKERLGEHDALGLRERLGEEEWRGLGEQLLDMAGERGLDEASGGLKQLEPFGRARQRFYGVAREGATGSGMVRQRLCRRQGTTGSGKGSMGLQERRYAPLSLSPCIVGDPLPPC